MVLVHLLAAAQPAADDCGEESLEVGDHVPRRSARLELGDDRLVLVVEDGG